MRLGRGYIAESGSPVVTAFGSSVEEAAENARLAAIAALEEMGFPGYPSTLIVRIDERGRSAIVMQSVAQPFSLAMAGKDARSCYFDYDGNAAPERQRHV